LAADPVDWIALNLLSCLGPTLKAQAWVRFGDPGEVAHRVPAEDLEELARRAPRELAPRLAEERRQLHARAREEHRRARSAGFAILTADHPKYPRLLSEISAPPPVLYVHGTLAVDPVRVAIVGSRRATGYGRRVAEELAAGLVRRGAEVVSGGARGVDAAAHRGALDADGRTVAVLGSGLLDPYPSDHGELFARVARRGCVVSEFPLDAPPLPEHFPRRNRLISGLSAAVVVVEAAERSGTLSTANHALEQGREVLAVPGPVHVLTSEGCHRLIRAGAGLARGIDDIVDDLPEVYRARLLPGPSSHDARPLPIPLDSLNEDERATLLALDPIEPTHLDTLVERVPIGIARIQVALFGLEVRGAVDHHPGGVWVARAPARP